MSPMAFLSRNLFFPLLMVYERSRVRRLWKAYEKSQFLSADAIRDLQLQRLRKLLIHAQANCPFYADRFAEAGFDPARVQSFGDITALPVLTKKDIQIQRDRMRATNLPPEEIIPDKTGGSTGQPLNFFVDRDRVFSRNALALRHDRWSGWEIGERSAYLWGHHEDLSAWSSLKARLRDALVERHIFLDTTNITRERLEGFTRKLKSYRPTLYVAYANSMYLYARYLHESGARDYHRPRGIITSAELLDDTRRDLIEQVFGCPVFNRYGSRETGMIASECERHTGLHIAAECLHVEILKDGQSAASGVSGKIVITDLMNYGMPFIRYQIEDVGMLLDRECPCGRGLPLMEIAGGRMTDFLVTPEGKIISGASMTIYLIANTPGVAQAQFVQEKKDEIILRLAPGEGFGPESEAFLEREIRKFFGSTINYRQEIVDSIPVSPSGKYRFSISTLDPSEWF